ncbi:MAG: winged helix-turn-helix transcriptional regulator [Candidatus Thorarchaeota archaeon]|nr:MAG: winged helix-turn-helix transcriptional regulator [Candidatus Thorarchaeota archaeon]
MNPEVSKKPMRDFEVVTDPKVIKLLLDTTRADIVFKYLVQGEMTVKQLADAMRKKPGTILHHVQKLKDAGIIVLARTRETPTGIIERYYRATAKEYRLGISEMLGVQQIISQTIDDRVSSIVSGLWVYGIRIPPEERQTAKKLLKNLVQREEKLRDEVPVLSEKEHESLPPALRSDLADVVRQYALHKDPQYRILLEEWYALLMKYHSDS